VLHLAGSDSFFNFGSGADFKNSTQNIAQLNQGGLGLPDRDYYTKDDAKSQQIRSAYLAHVAAILTLSGESPSAAATGAQTVMSIETALATSSLTRVQRRDPNAIYHKMSLAQLQSIAPNFDWQTYFSASSVMPSDINVAEPAFFQAFSSLLPTLGTDRLRAYLRWHLLHVYAVTLPKAYVDANFDFYSKQLQGTPQQLPRWKRCVRATDATLGEALGQLYVAKVFPPKAKAEALAMVKNIKSMLREDISTLSWMSAPTRQKAVDKLDAFILKIGYPDKWRDYSGLKIGRVAYATNVLASNEFETRRDYGKIGKNVDRSEWGLTPPTVNAYYNPTVNEIVFPAGILQPPFFNPNVDPAVNYGAIGAVIGHESTHGFDDQGRQFDKDGNLADWWTADDATSFTARANCIVDQFNALEVLPGVHENGKQVEGEAIADLGGLTIAYKAFEKWQAAHPRQTIDGFSPEQRFFIGFATFWSSNQRPEFMRLLANVDVHPYDKFRVNNTLSDMPQFAAAWFCKLNEAMVRPPASRCQIW
jgi:putative endopeptidase